MADQEGGHFVARSELVVLDVAVTDRRGEYVSGLSRSDFRVFENGEVRRLSFFLEQDAPATVGLVVDGSGSMFAVRDRVAAAVGAFAAASHPRDQFFAMAFNERVRPVLPRNRAFTGDAGVLRDALAIGLVARGRTALYDAVSAGLREVGRGRQERRILIVISDGGDNASGATADDVLERAQASSVVIHAVALADPLLRERNPRVLRRLATTTGGLAFEPRDVEGIGDALHRIARDIRSGYTLAYIPLPAGAGSEWRQIRVAASAPDGRRLVVRARTGYFAASEGESSPRAGER